MFAYIDDTLTHWMQVGYDYARDRWNIYVATYRVVILLFGLVFGVFGPAFAQTGDPLVKAVMVTAQLALFYYMMIRKHVEVEWELQYEGREKLLNRLTLRERRRMGSRIGVLFFLVIMTSAFSASATMMVLNIVSTLFFIAYLWSLCVLIRDRDESRFAQGKLANSFG